MIIYIFLYSFIYHCFPSYHVKPEIQALCGFDEFLYLLKQSLMGMDIIVSYTE